MSYRKIVVNDVTYEYTIGFSHTKIKNIGVFKNKEVGEMEFNEDLNENLLRISPQKVKEIILQTLGN